MKRGDRRLIVRRRTNAVNYSYGLRVLATERINPVVSLARHIATKNVHTRLQKVTDWAEEKSQITSTMVEGAGWDGGEYVR
jgi:hypothetical protein